MINQLVEPLFHLYIFHAIPLPKDRNPIPKMYCDIVFANSILLISIWKIESPHKINPYTKNASNPISIALSEGEIFAIIRSISYYSINKLFNINTGKIYNMTFKLKAWMIYLIGVVVIPYSIVTLLENFVGLKGTGCGFWCDVGSITFDTVAIGGAVLGIYYLIKRAGKKKEGTT